MEIPWYKEYFWLLIMGGIILVIAIFSFVLVCLCRTQLSRRLTMRNQGTSKQKKKQTQDQDVAVIKVNRIYRTRDPPPIILPHHQNEGMNTNHHMYATVKKDTVTFQQQAKNFKYNGHKYDVDLQIPNKNDRYSYASYDSVGHITDKDYINTENYTKDLEYIDVLAEDDDNYDDVEIF